MIDPELKQQVEELVKEFHKFWEAHGSPHPNSNDYMALNRAFFFNAGVQHGIQVANEINDNITRKLGED